MTSKKTPRHAHELGPDEPRWSARFKDGLVFITDEASQEEFQAGGYTVDGTSARFSLPGDNGLRTVRKGEPGFEELTKVFTKAGGGPSEEEAASAAPAAPASTTKTGR